MRKRAVAAMLTGLLLTTGCTEDSETGSGSPEATKTSEAGTSSSAGGISSVAFGEAHDFEDGVKIQVSRPKRFRPSADATTGGEPDYVRFSVTLSNDSDRPVSTDQVSVTVESGDGQAGDVIDETKGLTGAPTKRVAPGKAASWSLGFGVLDPQDVAVEVQVGMERDTVTFGG
jgi:hypothetical protein